MKLSPDMKSTDGAAASVEQDTAIPEKKPDVTGIVTDCSKLNVRKAPSANAEVAAVIPALTEVIIDIDKSTAEFYRVAAANGIQGFCMKKFIAIR